MNLVKIEFIWSLLIMSLGVALGLPAIAAEYPAKPITLIVPYPPGGSTDITARPLANAVRKYLGQPIIVENKSGGGGTVGPALVVTKPPDGYTLGIMSSSTVFGSWHMGKVNFNPIDDVTHIIRYSGYVYAIVVRADSQWKTIQEFLQYSKQNPEKVSYASSGIGTIMHLAMEELALMAGGIQWIHIPYKGSAEMIAAVLGGHADATQDSSAWVPLVEAGKLRLLATFSTQRLPSYPQIPTLKDVGYDIVYEAPIEVMGPKGMPRSIVKRLHDAFKKAMDVAEFQAVLKKLNMPMVYLNSEDCEKAVRHESQRIGNLVQKLGLQKKP